MANIAKGTFRPHTALSNMALAYFQNASNYFAKSIFPICPVLQSSDSYYIFDKEDLLRDDWQRKPAYGSVNPVPLSEHTDTYNCHVDQMKMGIDLIRQTDLDRRQGPTMMKAEQQRTRAIAEKANIHQDIMFAKNFFKTGVWSNEWTGVDTTTTSGKQFIKFSNDNSDPIKLIKEWMNEMNENTGRMPNRLALGTETFDALCEHPAILERVKYGGTTVNPANVNETVLSELFGIEQVKVLRSISNTAKIGKDANMQYIADPKSFLLAYATSAPSVDEPSAGYTFTWDMLGNGQILPIQKYYGEESTHTEYLEGTMATDMRKTADDLGIFCSESV